MDQAFGDCVEIVGMWFEILIIKWSWEILEWDLRS